MTDAPTCKICHTTLDPVTQVCSKCSNNLNSTSSAIEPASNKSALLTLLLCFFFGSLGIHRFYVGKIGTGILMLLTAGGFGLWVLIDLLFIVTNNFEDKQHNRLILIKNTSSLIKGLLILGIILAEFAVIALIFTSLVFSLTSGMTDSIHSQLDALREGNISKAYSYTALDFQKAVPLASFTKFVNAYPSLKTNTSSTFDKREFSNNLGTVSGTLHSKDGAETPVTYHLVKEHDSWKILEIIVAPVGAGVKTDTDQE